MEVYQLTILGVSLSTITLPAGLVDTFDNVCWRTHHRFNKWPSVSSLHQKCVQRVDILSMGGGAVAEWVRALACTGDRTVRDAGIGRRRRRL